MGGVGLGGVGLTVGEVLGTLGTGEADIIGCGGGECECVGCGDGASVGLFVGSFMLL